MLAARRPGMLQDVRMLLLCMDSSKVISHMAMLTALLTAVPSQIVKKTFGKLHLTGKTLSSC